MYVILRFEQADGTGIYQSGPCIPYNATRHPPPACDGGLKAWRDKYSAWERENFFFGFDSVEQARAWFYDWKVLLTLKQYGAKLRAYVVPDHAVHVGFAQTVFLIRHAELIAEFDPTELHEDEFCDVYDELTDAAQLQYTDIDNI
jgi:hypothetical protein